MNHTQFIKLQLNLNASANIGGILSFASAFTGVKTGKKVVKKDQKVSKNIAAKKNLKQPKTLAKSGADHNVVTLISTFVAGVIVWLAQGCIVARKISAKSIDSFLLKDSD